MLKKGFWKLPTALAVFYAAFALVLMACGGTGSPAGGGGGGGGGDTPTLVSLVITGSQSYPQYKGDPLDLTGVTVTANFSDGSSREVAPAISGFDPHKADSNQIINITYGGMTITFGVFVRIPGFIFPTGITVSQMPYKIFYEIGDYFDPTDLIVIGEYSDSSQRPLSINELGGLPTGPFTVAGPHAISINWAGHKYSFDVFIPYITLSGTIGAITKNNELHQHTWVLAYPHSIFSDHRNALTRVFVSPGDSIWEIRIPAFLESTRIYIFVFISTEAWYDAKNITHRNVQITNITGINLGSVNFRVPGYGNLGPTLNLGGQVWRMGFYDVQGDGYIEMRRSLEKFDGNRSIIPYMPVGGSGSITGGILNFTVGTPRPQMMMPISFLAEGLRQMYDNAQIIPSNARFSDVFEFTTFGDGRHGYLDRRSGLTEWDYTYQIGIDGFVTYIYVDRDVRITGRGRESWQPCDCADWGDRCCIDDGRTCYCDFTLITHDIDLHLKAGWNALHNSLAFRNGSSREMEIFYSLRDPENYKWVLYEGWISISPGIAPHSAAPERSSPAQAGRAAVRSPFRVHR